MIAVDKGKSKRVIVVFAADHGEYRNWVRTFGRHLGNVEFRMARSYRDVKGKHKDKTYVLFLHRCRQHMAFREMFPYTQRLKSLNRNALESRIKSYVAHRNLREEWKMGIDSRSKV